MLKTLYIQNFTLINELEIQFDKGLNIITGETGSGKSILIDAIDLAFGERASKDQIKAGEDKALIELQLELPQKFPLELFEENGIEVEDDNLIILSREILQKATRSRVNGVLVTQNYIQEIKKHLIDIHSQNETYTYIQPKTHINLLDNYGSQTHSELIEKYKTIYFKFIDIKKEFEKRKTDAQSVEQRIDFLRFQVNEIEDAKIKNESEYEELINERSVLVNAESLKETAYTSYGALYGEDGSVIDILKSLEKKLNKASEFDEKLSEIAEILSDSAINLKEASNDLRGYAENIDTNEQRVAEIEERIDILDKMKRKYGPTLNDVILNFEKFSNELSEIEFSSEHLEKLEVTINKLQAEIQALSTELSQSRIKLAEHLSSLIKTELVKLEMPKVQFKINVDKKESPDINGIDDVEFLITTNPGEPLKPLAKVASGGEVSRVMLAVKTVFAKADGVDSVIFDEIDTGISGKASQAVAEELARLANIHQIICITHQPIIAAMADRHFFVEKMHTNNSTQVLISILDEIKKVSAISSLASGGEDANSLEFAGKLLQQAKKFKESFGSIKI